jgi:hypothetical protein
MSAHRHLPEQQPTPLCSASILSNAFGTFTQFHLPAKFSLLNRGMVVAQIFIAYPLICCRVLHYFGHTGTMTKVHRFSGLLCGRSSTAGSSSTTVLLPQALRLPVLLQRVVVPLGAQAASRATITNNPNNFKKQTMVLHPFPPITN